MEHNFNVELFNIIKHGVNGDKDRARAYAEFFVSKSESSKDEFIISMRKMIMQLLSGDKNHIVTLDGNSEIKKQLCAACINPHELVYRGCDICKYKPSYPDIPTPKHTSCSGCRYYYVIKNILCSHPSGEPCLKGVFEKYESLLASFSK